MKAYAGGSGGGKGYQGVTGDGSDGLLIVGDVTSGGGLGRMTAAGNMLIKNVRVRGAGDTFSGGMVMLDQGVLHDSDMGTAGPPLGHNYLSGIYCTHEGSLWVWDGAGWHKI